jgi:hypothetical protein
MFIWYASQFFLLKFGKVSEPFSILDETLVSSLGQPVRIRAPDDEFDHPSGSGGESIRPRGKEGSSLGRPLTPPSPVLVRAIDQLAF